MNKYIRQLKKDAAALLAALLVFGACLPANGEESLSVAEFVPEAELTGGTGTAAETSSDAVRTGEAAAAGEETPAPDGYEGTGNTVSEETSGEAFPEENASAAAAGAAVNTASEAEEGEFAFAGGYLSSNYTASRISRGSLLCAGSGAALTAAENSLPSSYSSETEGYTTGIKNQGSDATCWAFAYTETAETDMLQDGSGTTTETVYSPLGTAYFFYNIPEDPLGLVGKKTENKIKTPLYDLDYNWKNRGGSLLLTARTMSGWYGTFSENEFPYTDEKKDSISKDDYKTGTLKAVQTGAYFIQKAERNEIKKTVIKCGSVQVAYHTEAKPNSAEFLKTVSETSGDKDCYVFRKYRYDSQGNELSANHCVQIVGWDDSISKEQFTHRENGRTVTPRENGAWLVRNSWGENWPASWSSQQVNIAHPGYFWLSYEDATIENTLAATETEPAANYLNNYHYDGSASMKSQSLAKAATVFQAQYDECITAVNVGFESANVSYKADVYVYGDKPANPDEGTVAATATGSTTAEGFYTLKLSEAVSIKENQYFSVVITPGMITDFYVEQYDNDSDFSGQLTFIPDISAGQGFYKEGLYDAYWYDGGSSQKDYADRFCPRIKAFTAKYAIHYDLDGGTGDNPAGYTGKADLTLREPVKTGYAFTGWTYEGTAVPTKNVTIPAGTTGDLSFTAHWEEAGTVYQVKHCREKLSGSGWDVETESFTGTTGTSVTPAVKTYEGYSSPKAQTGKIAESGTEFLYFYTRKSYEVTLTGGTGISSVSGAGTYKYGDTVTVSAEVNSGYNWNKWTGSYESAEKTFSFTMPAGNVSLTASASYQQSGGGSGSGGGGSGGGGGGSSGGGGGGGGISTGLKTAATATFSKNWFADIYGVWRIRDKTGAIVKSAWLCDDAVTANGSNVWYLLNTDGTMLAAGLVQDNTGNFYSLETTHNGYYGMLRYKNGTYDCSGQQVYLEFNNKHDGSFGAVTNPEGLARLAAIYGVTKFGIGNDSIVCTKSFE